MTGNAHDFIREFTEGYDTDVGESSAMVSGGQKQVTFTQYILSYQYTHTRIINIRLLILHSTSHNTYICHGQRRPKTGHTIHNSPSQYTRDATQSIS